MRGGVVSVRETLEALLGGQPADTDTTMTRRRPSRPVVRSPGEATEPTDPSPADCPCPGASVGDSSQTRLREESGDGSTESPRDATPPDARVPRWVAADDPIGGPPDRQVLVVGDGSAGLALACFLQRAGGDPVLVGGRASATGSRLTLLTPSLRRLLSTLDVGTPLHDRGYAVETVSVEGPGTTAGATVLSKDPDRPAPAVVRTRALRRALGDDLSGSRVGRARTVEALSRRERGIVVTFDDGVREWFDVVVDAGGAETPLGTGGDRDGDVSATLAQWEAPVETDDGARPRLRELWYSDALVQLTPRPGGPGSLLRVTASAPDAADVPGGAGRAEDLPADLPASLAARIDGRDPAVVRQHRGRTADVVPARWGGGRVARCGPAGFAVAPATGLGATLAVADAWVLADELVRGPASARGVVEAYGRRRSRRTTAILRRIGGIADEGYPAPEAASQALTTVARLRGAALGGVCGPSMAALHEDVLDRV